MFRLLAAAALLPAAAHAQQRASALFLDAPSPQLTAGDAFKLAAAAYDANGVLIKGATLTWSHGLTSPSSTPFVRACAGKPPGH